MRGLCGRKPLPRLGRVMKWSADSLLELARGYQGAAVFAAAADLDLFSALAAGPLEASAPVADQATAPNRANVRDLRLRPRAAGAAGGKDERQHDDRVRQDSPHPGSNGHRAPPGRGYVRPRAPGFGLPEPGLTRQARMQVGEAGARPWLAIRRAASPARRIASQVESMGPVPRSPAAPIARRCARDRARRPPRTHARPT